MTKYTLRQIINAWFCAYGEDMQEEYSGFIEELRGETNKETDIKNLKKQIKNEN